MLSTSARLLRLLGLLQERPLCSASDLAGTLEITERTVRRDIDRLRDLGYPIESTGGVGGGYRFGVGGTLPPLLLDDEEAVAVVLGLRATSAGTVTGIDEAAVRALAKLDRLLPSRLRYRVSALQASTVTLSAGTTPVSPDLLVGIAAACREQEHVRFAYTAHGVGQATTRHVQPHRLVHTGRRWYLVARDLDRDDWRTFRVDRIDRLHPTGRRFTPVDPPDAAAFVARAVSAAPYRHVARIVLAAPAQQMTDAIPATVGTIEAIDAESCRLVTGSDSLDAIALHLAWLGCAFHVEDPPELRDALARLGNRMLAAAAEASCPAR